MRYNKYFVLAAFLATFAVILGAFGAHALKKMLDPEGLEVFKTGVQYQFYHTVGIFIAAFGLQYGESKWLHRSIYAFLLGIVCFSGSLYGLTWAKCSNASESFRWLGPITPLGGALFIAAWVMLGIAFRSLDKRA